MLLGSITTWREKLNLIKSTHQTSFLVRASAWLYVVLSTYNNHLLSGQVSFSLRPVESGTFSQGQWLMTFDPTTNEFVQIIRPSAYKIVQVSPLSLVESGQIHRINVLGHLTQWVCPDDKTLTAWDCPGITTGHFKKNFTHGIPKIYPATHMLEGWDTSNLQGGIHSFVWSPETFLNNIMEPRYK